MSRPGKNQADRDDDPALYKFQKSDAKSLADLHLVCPLPKSVMPTRIREWCRENCEGYWQIHYPAKGMATYKNSVILFELDEDCDAYRQKYCFDNRYHKYHVETDWVDAMRDNE